MTQEEFEKKIGEFGDEIEAINRLLLDIGGILVAKMKNKAPVDTGELKKSIRAEVSNYTLQFKMLNYGSFQNYGVRGKSDKRGVKVEFGVQPRPTNEPYYAFKKRRFGLTNRNFFNLNDMTDEVVEYLTEKLMEKI
jgi:hypothetical protein